MYTEKGGWLAETCTAQVERHDCFAVMHAVQAGRCGWLAVTYIASVGKCGCFAGVQDGWLVEKYIAALTG